MRQRVPRLIVGACELRPLKDNIAALHKVTFERSLDHRVLAILFG